MDNIYIILILVAGLLFICYKIGLLGFLFNKSLIIGSKIDSGIRQFDKEARLQSKAHKKYRSFMRNDKEI